MKKKMILIVAIVSVVLTMGLFLVFKNDINNEVGNKVGNGNIGVATMTEDGTIVLDLRAEETDGTIGDARLTYPKTHADYQKILDHLGGLRPGEKKSVPPWPD
jgi:hypothetical protein